ncbi:MAG: hypothetical protein QXS02_06645, partial [Candidatus Thermoplasmatota archaeon]
MKKVRMIWNDEWARIPFSVIGVFLIIGSSVTATYIAQLEKDKAKELSLTININDIEPVVRYVEADLARALNYAACKAFEAVGKNPVFVPVSGTMFYFDANGRDGVDYVDVNLNRVCFETYNNLSSMVSENFQKGRYIQGKYNVAVTMPTSWRDLRVEDVLDLYLSRVLDNIVQPCKNSYPVYPVLGVNMSISVYDMEKGKTVFEKKSFIMTIITNRYLLLEDLTNEFDKRIDGSFGPIGIDALSYAMILTWVHAWAQYFTGKPLNIISTQWLETVTNTGILLEEGFVFNSVDPLGMVYTGYETIRSIAEDFGVKLSGEDLKRYFADQISNPMNRSGFQERNDEIMKSLGLNPLTQDQLKFDMDANISMICREAYNWITGDPEGETVKSVANGYSADLYTRVTRETISDNENGIISQQNSALQSSLDDEIKREDEARRKAQEYCQQYCTNCSVESVTLLTKEHRRINYPLKGDWSINNAVNKGCYNFDNSKLPVILAGEKWIVDRSRTYKYTWETRSKWKANLICNSVVITKEFYLSYIQHEQTYNNSQSQWVNITFGSNVFSKLGGTQSDIINPFQEVAFQGKTDPNLASVYKLEPPMDRWSITQRYKMDINWPSDMNWDSEPRKELLRDTSGDTNKKNYPELTNPGNHIYNYILYPSWIY